MSNRQVRRQATASASKVPAKRARYGDASTSQSNPTHDQLTSPQSSRRSFTDGGGNDIGSAYKELGSQSQSRDEKDVQMPVVKVARADLSLLKSENTSSTRRSSTRNERSSRKDSLVKRDESPSVGPSSTKIPLESNAGSSGRGKSRQQTPGQVILPSKRPLDLALGLGHLEASKASPFSLTAQFHKVMESISNSESSTSMRRKKLSARKSTSSRSSVSFKAFPEKSRSKSENSASQGVERGEIDDSSLLSSPPRKIVAVDEEVSFSLPVKMTNEQDPKQRRSSDLNTSGSSSRHLEGIAAREGKVHQMAARKAYPYQINSRNDSTFGKQKEIKGASPFVAARKSAPYSQVTVHQKYPKTQGDRRESSTSADQEISSNNVESHKRPTAARKSYPASIKRVKGSRDSISSDTESQVRSTAARKSYPASINAWRGSRDSVPSDGKSEKRTTAARKSYPAAFKAGRDSQDSVPSDMGSQERTTAARKSYPASINTWRGSQHSVPSDGKSEKGTTAARKSYPATINAWRGSRDSVSSDGKSEKGTAARKSYPAASNSWRGSRDSVPSDGKSEKGTAARKSYPATINAWRGSRDSVSSDGKSEKGTTAARKSYPAASNAWRGSRDSVPSDGKSEKGTAARKSYPATINAWRGSRDSVSSDGKSEKGTAARKSYPATINAWRGSRDSVSSVGKSEKGTAARKSYPAASNSWRGSRDSVPRDGKSEKGTTAARKSYPAASNAWRGSRDSVPSDGNSEKGTTAARKSYPAASNAWRGSRDTVPSDGKSEKGTTAARKSYPAAFKSGRDSQDSVPSDIGSRERTTAARKSYPASIKTRRVSQDYISSDVESQKQPTAARKSYPAASNSRRGSLQEPDASDLRSQKKTTAARKSYPHSATAALHPSLTGGRIGRNSASDGYLSMREQPQEGHSEKTAPTNERTNVPKTTATLPLTAKKTDPYRMTILGKQCETKETAKSPATLQWKAGKNPSIVPLSVKKSESYRMDMGGKKSGITSKTAIQSPLGSQVATGKTDPSHQTPTNGGKDTIVHRAARKAAPGSYRTVGKADSYKMSDRGKAARKSAPYQQIQVSGNRKMDETHKTARKSVSRQTAQERNIRLYGDKVRTGQCSVPLVDAARDVAISIGTNLQTEGTPSGSESTRNGEAEKESEESEKVVLHQKYDGKSGDKEDLTKSISGNDNAEVNSRTSRRRRGEKTTKSPSFDFKETTEEGRGKFHIVTLGHSSMSNASHLATPRSKYARQSLQSSSTQSHYHRRESMQSKKQKSSQKEETFSGAEQQRNSSPTFGRHVSYESKPSVGCKVNDGWKVLSIGKITRKETTPKKKGSIHSTGRKRSQEIDSDESSDDVDLTSSLNEDDDDDEEDDEGDVASNKASEATEPSCQDRNIFDMFKIPMSNKTTSKFPPVSIENTSKLIETEKQTTAESSEQSTTSSEVISMEDGTLITESSLSEQEETETPDPIKDLNEDDDDVDDDDVDDDGDVASNKETSLNPDKIPSKDSKSETTEPSCQGSLSVQREDTKESDSSDQKNIEKLTENSKPEKKLSFSVDEEALTADTDGAEVSKGTSSLKDVKELANPSEDNSEILPPSRGSKGQKGDITKVSTVEELPHTTGIVTRDPEVVYTSLRRMTRSERERIKSAERDFEKVVGKEVSVVVRKIPATIGNETQLETGKKEETPSLQQESVELAEKSCTPSIKDDKKEIVAIKDGDDRNILEPSKSDSFKDENERNLDKSVGISEEMSGAKQMEEEAMELLGGTDEDDSDALGEAIADFLDNKDIDRIELNSSSDAISESTEGKVDNGEEETKVVQKEPNTPMVWENGKEEPKNMQSEDNVPPALEDGNVLDNIGKESEKDGVINEPSLEPLPEKEDEQEEEEDDSRNIFAIFQKADKEETSPSKEKKRSSINVENSERNTKSSDWDDLKEQKKASATGQGKSNDEVIEGGPAETNAEKRNIFQMFQKNISGDRKAGTVKTPVLKVVKELAKDVGEKEDGNTGLAATSLKSGTTIDEGETADEGITKGLTVEADEPSCGSHFVSPEGESCPQSGRDSLREQEIQSIPSDVEPELFSVSKEPDPLIPSDGASEHGTQSNMDVEQNIDEHLAVETLPPSQTSEDSGKDKKEDNLDDVSSEKIEKTGEKSAMDITVEGLKDSDLTNMAADEGIEVGEHGVDGTAPQNEDGLSKPADGDHSEPNEMSASEGLPPMLELFNADDENGSKLAESSEESACMPIIVSVSSVTSGDGFLSPSPLKLSQAEDAIRSEEGSITTLGSFGDDQGVEGFVEGSSTNDRGESSLPSQKDDINPVQSELPGTNLDSYDDTAITPETFSTPSNADSYDDAGEVDIIDGISFMSFSTKEEILTFINLRKANKKGKTKKKTSLMTSVWAMSKKKKKPVKKSPPKPIHNIFPSRPKDHSQKCIEDYQEKFLKNLRKQKRNEILHPALLKRGVSIKRSLDCGIPLLIDLELLDVRLDEEIPRPKKDKNQSEICKRAEVPKEPVATPLTEEDEYDIVTTVGLSDDNVLTEGVTRRDEDVAVPTAGGEIQEQNEDSKKAPEKSTSLEDTGNEDKSVSQDKVLANEDKSVSRDEVLAKEHAVFKPFEKPVTSQKSAFFSSELDTYLNKLEEEKRGQLTPKSPKNKPKKPCKSRHMDKLNSAIQEISFSSLFKGKQKHSDASSKTMEKSNKSPQASLQSKVGKNVDTSKELDMFLIPSIRKTRIGTTILKKSTAGSTRFRGPLPSLKDLPKKNKKKITDLPPNTSIIYLPDEDDPMKAPRRNRQSRFLDRLVSNVKKATEAEKKMPLGFNQGQGEKASKVDMTTVPLPSGETNDPTLGMWVSPNDVLPVRGSDSLSVNPTLFMVGKSQENIPSTSKQRLPSEKNLLEYFKEDPLPRDYEDLPRVTTPCGNDFCRLGCLCSSLQTKFDEMPPEHCRKLECMLECNCERFPSLRILRARKRPAIFHQDGMVFYDAAGLLSEADDRKRRRLDPSIPIDESEPPVREKSPTKKVVKSSSNSSPLKESDQKIEETEKVTISKLLIKPQRKEPGFARGRAYIAKHIRHAAKQEGQGQNDAGGGDIGTKNVVPPVKVVRTVDGYCVKPATNVNQTDDTDVGDAVEEGFKLLKKVDRMLYLSQRYKQKAQSQTRGPSKDPEQGLNEKSASQADHPSVSSGEVSGASANPGVGPSGRVASGSQDSSDAGLETTTKKPSVDMHKGQSEMAPTTDNQVDQDKEGDMMKNKPNSIQQSVTQENSDSQGVIDHHFDGPSTKEKALIKVPITPPKPFSDGQIFQFHQYMPTDVDSLPDSGGGKTQPQASSEILHTSLSTSQVLGTYSANSMSKQGLIAGSSSQSAPSTSLIQGPHSANPKFRQGLTSQTSSTSTPPQRVMVAGGKIVQQQAHGLLLQQGHGGGQFISLPVQPHVLHQSKQLPVVPGQSSVPSSPQQTLPAKPGGPSENKLMVLPPNKPVVQAGAVINPQLLRVPQKVVDGKVEKQLIFIPQGKSLGTTVPAVVNKDNTNFQAFWLQTTAGKAPVLLVPVQPKIIEQSSQPRLLVMPSSESNLSVAEQMKLREKKAKQKELEDCYGLKAFNSPQRGVIRPLCELAGYVTAQGRDGMDPTPFPKKQSLFIPNTHLMNPNKAFHLLIDLYSDCQWEQDRQQLFNIIFKMASKVKVTESVTVSGYRVVRTSFIKHTQKAKSINVSSSVARNCTTKIRIIGLFQSDFKITRVESTGTIMNPETKVHVPGHVETSHLNPGVWSFGNQSKERLPPKQDGGEDKGSKERSEKKDGRKKVNILRTSRNVEQKEQVATKAALGVGFTGEPRSLIKGLGGVVVNPRTEKKPVEDKNSRELSTGRKNQMILPKIPAGVIPGCLGQMTLVRKPEGLHFILVGQDSLCGVGFPAGDKLKQTEEKIIGQDEESMERSREETAGKATEKRIGQGNEDMLERPVVVPLHKEGDQNSSNMTDKGDGETIQHVSEKSDNESTSKLVVGAHDQLPEAVTTNMENITSDGIEERKNVESDGMEEGQNVKSDGIDEGKSVKPDGIEEGKNVESDGIEERKNVGSDGIEEGQNVKSDGIEERKNVESDGIEEGKNVESDGIEEGQNVKSDGIEERKNVESDGIEEGKNVESDGIEEGQNVKSDGKDEGKSVESDGVEERKNVESDGMEEGQNVKLDGIDEGKSVKPDGVEEGKTVESDGIEERKNVESDGMEEGQNVKLDGIDEGKSVKPDGIEERKNVESDGIEERKNVESDGMEEGQNVKSDGIDEGKSVTPDGVEEGKTVESDGMDEGRRVESDGIDEGKTVKPDGVKEVKSVESDGIEERKNVESDGIEEGKNVKSDGIDEGKSVTPDEIEEGKTVESDGIKERENVESDGIEERKNVESDGMEEGQNVKSDGIDEGKSVTPDKIEEGKTVKSDGIEERKNVESDGMEEGQNVKSDGIDEGKSVTPDEIEDGKTVESDGIEERENVESDGIEERKNVESDGMEEGQNVKSDGIDEGKSVTPDEIEEGKTVKSDGIEERKNVESDGMEEGQNVKSDGKDEGKSVKPDEIEEGKTVESDGIEERKNVESDGMEEGQNVKSDGIDEGKSVKPDGIEEGKNVDSDAMEEGKNVESDGIDEGKSVKSDGIEERKNVESDGMEEGQSVKSDGIEEGKNVDSDAMEEGKNVESDGVDEGKSVKSGGMEERKNVKSDGIEEGKNVDSDAMEEGKNVESDGIDEGKSVKSDGIEERKNVESDGMEEGQSVKSDGIEEGKNVDSDAMEEGKNVESDGVDEGKSVKSGGMEERKNVKSDGIEEGKNVASDGIEEGKNVASDEIEEGNKEMTEKNSGSQQKIAGGNESGEDDKDMEVHNAESILDGKAEGETASGTNLDKKLPKGSDEMVKEDAKSEVAGSSESFNLQTKDTTISQERKHVDEDKSKDSNEVKILSPSHEMTGVQDQSETTELSSESRSGQNVSSSSLEKESEEIVKKDVASEMKVDDKCVGTSEGVPRLVSGGEETAATEGNKDVGESKKDTSLKEQNDDCILLDDVDKESEDGKKKGEVGADSQEETKGVDSEQQDEDGTRSLHNLVTNLSSRVSDVGDEESKDAEKQPEGSGDKQEVESISSSSSSEDEVTSSDSDSGSDSEVVDEETNQTLKRRDWFDGAGFCTIRLSTLIENCFSGSAPFTAKWPEGYLDKRGWAEGMPKSKKVYETPFLGGSLSGNILAWPLKPKKKEVKFMSPDSLSDLYKKREEQKHEEKKQKARRLAHVRRQSFMSLPPSQRLPKRDKVKSLEYCLVDKKEPEVTDEDVDILGFDDDDEYYTTDDDSIYTDSSYEDEQRSKNEALFSLAVIPSFAGRFKALLEKRGAIETASKEDSSSESGVFPTDRSEMQSPLVSEVRDQLFLKDADFGSSGDESDSSLDVEKWSDSESRRIDMFKERTMKKSTKSIQGIDHTYTTAVDQSLTSPSRNKKRKGNVKEKRKGAISEKETFLSLCVQHSSDNESTSNKSDKDSGFTRGPQKHEIHIFKERQRRAHQRTQFLRLGDAIFEPSVVPTKAKIAILKEAYDVIKAEKEKAKALDEELSAQRFCNYTLRTKIKNLLKENPHLINLMCNPVKTPAVLENVAEKMGKDGSVTDGASEGQQEKNYVFKHLLPEQTQPEPFDVAQSAQKLLGAMKMCMTRAAKKKESVCHWTIQSMLDSGNEKLPSYLRTKEHMRKPAIDFESEHYIISQKIQQERAARWKRKKRAIMRRESRLRIGSFINAKGSGGLVFTKGVTPLVKKQTLEKSSRRTNDEDDGDSVNLSVDSPASSLLDTIEDNESLKNNDDDDEDSSLEGSLVCIAEPDEMEDPGTSQKPVSEKGHSKANKKSKKRDKFSKKRKRSESSSEDEDNPSPFTAFDIDESLPFEGEDGWIDDEPHPEDGWEEEEGMGGSIAKTDKTGGVKTGHKEPSVKAKTGDSEGGKAVNIDEERSDSKEKDARNKNQGSKQDSTSSEMSDINVDVRKIIPCLQVEEKDDGTLDVVLQGEFSDERLDELFARPGVMDYLKKVAAQKKKIKAKDKPSGSGK